MKYQSKVNDPEEKTADDSLIGKTLFELTGGVGDSEVNRNSGV